tara:strand:- start:1494 stop:2357 length:864 start_codon:yes stop_codon:yes gene_type:complete
MNKYLRRLFCCTSQSNKVITPGRNSSHVIAYGAHGEVSKELIDGKLYASKKFKRESMYNKEVRILKKIANTKHLQKFKFNNDEKMIIYNEFIPGQDLFYYIQNKTIKEKKFNDKKNMAIVDDKIIKKITKQVIVGLEELNKFGFVHLDIKLENIIVDKYLNATIIDFDTAHYLFNNTSLNVLLRFVGTINYAAPEIYQKYYTSKSDIWSLGVIIWILKTGNYPYILSEDDVYIKEMNEVCNLGIQSFNNIEIVNECEIFLDLIENMFKENSQERYSLQDVKMHPFLN